MPASGLCHLQARDFQPAKSLWGLCQPLGIPGTLLHSTARGELLALCHCLHEHRARSAAPSTKTRFCSARDWAQRVLLVSGAGVIPPSHPWQWSRDPGLCPAPSRFCSAPRGVARIPPTRRVPRCCCCCWHHAAPAGREESQRARYIRVAFHSTLLLGRRGDAACPDVFQQVALNGARSGQEALQSSFRLFGDSTSLRAFWSSRAGGGRKMPPDHIPTSSRRPHKPAGPKPPGGSRCHCSTWRVSGGLREEMAAVADSPRGRSRARASPRPPARAGAEAGGEVLLPVWDQDRVLHGHARHPPLLCRLHANWVRLTP